MTTRKTSALPLLYAIVNAETCARRGVEPVAMARDLCDAGVRLVQYRDKLNAPAEIVRTARAIGEIFAATTDARLVMNDRADLAVLAGWRGVHVGQDDLPAVDALRVLAGATGDAFVGVSTHDDAQIAAANLSPASYVAVGPVFSTATKHDAEPVVGLDGVRRARAATRKPLVAIGGITLANARSVLSAGADSVAVISGLFVAGSTIRQSVEAWMLELAR